MEKSIEKHLDDVMATPGVIGAVCTDAQGLCVGARGVGNRANAGNIAGLAQQAKSLHPDVKEEPVVCIDSDAGSVLIKAQDGITFAIHKMPS